MAVNVTSVEVLDNPSAFTNPLQFEIQYECLHQLQKGELLLQPGVAAEVFSVSSRDGGQTWQDTGVFSASHILRLVEWASLLK